MGLLLCATRRLLSVTLFAQPVVARSQNSLTSLSVLLPPARRSQPLVVLGQPKHVCSSGTRLPPPKRMRRPQPQPQPHPQLQRRRTSPSNPSQPQLSWLPLSLLRSKSLAINWLQIHNDICVEKQRNN